MKVFVYKITLGFFLLFAGFEGMSTSYTVGTLGKDYISPNALYNANVLNDGDSILIDPQTFTGTACLAAWNKNNLKIIGIGPSKSKMVANGASLLGKGIWICIGNDISVENIEFSGASVPDQNGAGIRLDGSGLTVHHCYFHHNEDGILTSNPGTGDIIIESSEFAYNGFGDGQSHNLYIGRVNSLTFRYNYSHHAIIGHNLKTRAKENYIEYNRIMDEATGNSSYLIDFSIGGLAILKGNLLMQGVNTDNCNLIGYGLEGLQSGYAKDIYVINNTFVNKRSPGCNFININSGATSAKLYNNIFAGQGSIIGSFPATSVGNLNVSDWSTAGFVDEANFDYHLVSASSAINIGSVVPPIGTLNLFAEKEYLYPASFSARSQNGAIDAGAYEYVTVLALEEQDEDSTDSSSGKPKAKLQIYPNPSRDWSSIQVVDNISVENISLFSISGVPIKDFHQNKDLDLSNLVTGTYILIIKLQKRDPIIKLLVKI